MEYIRNCPKCGKELKTENKYYFNKSMLANSPCLSCSQKGKVFSEEHRENLKKNHADISGEKNPFYKKKHSDETKNKISDKNRERFSTDHARKSISDRQKLYHLTNDNGFKGKTHSPETKNKLKEIANKRFENIEEKKKIGDGLREWHKNNENSFKGKQHTDYSKQKQRVSAIKRIERLKFNGNSVTPNYNPKEMEYFNKIEKEMKLNGIYIGKNGSQYYIKELGYFPDFYDPVKNVIIEYDEKHHYVDVYSNKLKNKDIKRQSEIMQKLGCKFYRYNETIDLLYEVLVNENQTNN